MSTKPIRRTRVRSLGLCALVLAACLASPAREVAAAPPKAKPKLLLLPFVVHSSEDPEYVRDGLSDMLTARFARIGALQLIRPSGPQAGTTKLETALAAGRKAGADFVLYGSFTRFGQGASLDVQCAPVLDGNGPEPLREIFVHSGSIGEIIPDLDDLAGKVSRFARGEVPGSPVAAAGGGPQPAAAAPNQDLADLLLRIEALEDSVTRILESEGSDESADEGAEKLR